MPRLLLTLSIASLLTAPADAGLRQYQASLDKSQWELTERTPLICKMEHAIPRFGKARFLSKAGKEMSLQVMLDGMRLPRMAANARLVAVPPSYKPGQAPAHMANIRVVQGFDTYLSERDSWSVVTELEQGNNPTLYYEDGYRVGSHISVMLNSANFNHGYDKFLDCVGELLPYGFEDVKQTVLNYRSNSDELDLESLRRLHKVVDYLRHDPAITKIEIGAYSDSYGGRWHNFELSKKRANAIKAFLQEAGINSELLQATGYGERRHIASNETPIGRQQNRRVIMKLTRDLSYDEKMKLPSERARKEKQAKQKSSSAPVETAATQP